MPNLPTSVSATHMSTNIWVLILGMHGFMSGSK